MKAERGSFSEAIGGKMKKNSRWAMRLLPIALFAGATANAAVVNLVSVLNNPSFEANTGGCPTGWTCASNIANAFEVTTHEFLPGPANGLGAGKLTPDGKNAVVMPPISGASYLSQNFGVFAADTDYTLTIWIGTPLNVPPPQPDRPAGPVMSVINFNFLAGPAANIAVGPTFVFDSGAPGAPIGPPLGQWVSYTLTLLASDIQGSAIGQAATFRIRVESGLNESIAAFDIATLEPVLEETPLPEPGSMALFGIGLVSVEAIRRWRKAKS